MLYAVGAYLQIRSLSGAAQRWHFAVAGPAVVLHAWVAFTLIFTPEGIHLGIYPISTLISFIMVAFVMVATLRDNVQGLLVLLYPLAAITLLLSAGFDSSFTPLTDLDGSLTTHILVSIIAYAILMMAACQSLLVGQMERRLRNKQKLALLAILPPLESMESLLFAMLWVGFATLTAAIATGFLFLDDMFAQSVVHHTVLSSASWLAYLALLVGRQVFGWRGTAAVRWTLVAFALLLLGYFGSKFVLEIVLQRQG